MSRKDRRHDPETAERVTSIVEAAERAAAALMDKTEASARRYLTEAEAEADRAAATRLQALLETADALQAQADAVRRETARLLESLRHAEIGPQAPAVSPPAVAGGQAAAVAEPQAADAGSGDGLAGRTKHLSAVPGPEPAPSTPAEPEPTVSPELDPSAVATPDLGERRGSDGAAGARLLATQMAVSGHSRREIEAKLSRGFRIDDPAPILDAILGPED